MGLFSLVISAIVGLVGIWSEFFIGPKNKKLQNKKRTLIVRVVSTLFALITLIIGYLILNDENKKAGQAKVTAEIETRSRTIAYKKLDSTYNQALHTGKAVNNISNATRSLSDSLDTLKIRLGNFSRTQVEKLKAINEQTITLLNPIPSSIYLSYLVSFDVDSIMVNILDSLTMGKEKFGFPEYFAITDKMLKDKAEKYFDGFMGDEFDITLTMNTGRKSLKYFGRMNDFVIPDKNNDFFLSDDNSLPILNKDSKPFAGLFYFKFIKTIVLAGVVKLDLSLVSHNIKSLTEFRKCKFVFAPKIISIFIENPVTNDAKIVCQINDKIKIDQEDLVYNKVSSQYETKEIDIFQKAY
jgi:hypothetical protein